MFVQMSDTLNTTVTNEVTTLMPTLDLVIDAHGRKVPQNILKFQNYYKQQKILFVVYADFEHS